MILAKGSTLVEVRRNLAHFQLAEVDSAAVALYPGRDRTVDIVAVAGIVVAPAGSLAGIGAAAVTVVDTFLIGWVVRMVNVVCWCIQEAWMPSWTWYR